ncbi:MAG: SigB/SigF/SigG family RNA polymerase sigma factor [Mycobacterium sp.]
MTPSQLQAEHHTGAAMPAHAPTAAAAHDDDYTQVSALCRVFTEVTDDKERRRLRSRIITASLPLADHIAYRYVGRGESADDLIQVARMGLIKAIDRYDPAKGQFLGFVVPTIMGEVRRHFRDNTWGIHVPRKVKDTHRRVHATSGQLAQQLGRAPTAREVAAELGIDHEDVVQALEATNAYRPLSLDSAMPGSPNAEPQNAWRHGAEDSRYNTVEDALTVAELVGRLTEREKVILRLRFRDDLPQTQIAARLGISQVHVSRLLAATLARLRQYFWDDAPARRGALVGLCCVVAV